MANEKDSTQKIISITNCIDCPFHSVRPDPDPDDWFNDDDVKVVCTKTNKEITSMCRPYNLRKESDIPDWCPLDEKMKHFFAIPFIDLKNNNHHDKN